MSRAHERAARGPAGPIDIGAIVLSHYTLEHYSAEELHSEPLTETEVAALRASMDANLAKHSPANCRARQWRWRRFVVTRGGKGVRGYAREAFIQEKGLIMIFDAQEATQ
jgi:hypothetical protein